MGAIRKDIMTEGKKLQDGALVYTSKAMGEEGVQVDIRMTPFWCEDCITMRSGC